MVRNVDEFLALLARFEPGADPRAGTSYTWAIEVVSVTTSVGQMLRNDPNRVSWTACNLGTSDAWIGPNRSVAANSGFPIAANKGVVGTNWFDDLIQPSFEVFVIGSGAVTVIVSTLTKV